MVHAAHAKQPQAAASSRKQPQAAAPRQPTPTINTALVLQIEQSPEVNPVSHKQPNTLSASQLVYSWNNTEPAVAPATSAREGERVPTNEGKDSEAQSSGVLFKLAVCVCACVCHCVCVRVCIRDVGDARCVADYVLRKARLTNSREHRQLPHRQALAMPAAVVGTLVCRVAGANRRRARHVGS